MSNHPPAAPTRAGTLYTICFAGVSTKRVCVAPAPSHHSKRPTRFIFVSCFTQGRVLRKPPPITLQDPLHLFLSDVSHKVVCCTVPLPPQQKTHSIYFVHCFTHGCVLRRPAPTTAKDHSALFVRGIEMGCLFPQGPSHYGERPTPSSSSGGLTCGCLFPQGPSHHD